MHARSSRANCLLDASAGVGAMATARPLRTATIVRPIAPIARAAGYAPSGLSANVVTVRNRFVVGAVGGVAILVAAVCECFN